MTYLTRMTLAAGLAAALLSSPTSAFAQAAAAAPNPQAEALNEEGKTLYKNGNFAGAAEKFRQAIQLSPNDPRYYFNLCATLGSLEQYDDALTGSPYTMQLTGNDGDDRITGGSGQELLAGGHGQDRIDARDGATDTVDCGGQLFDWAAVDLGGEAAIAGCDQVVF